ncbi:glycosyltransferase [Odoribacter sp. OttesenSCG-928-A06]|nr:glycosyltransferase [Odoribacter sp. OttesenSCG-928-A06]
MKKIAVLFPVYKNDKLAFLSLAIESILDQTYQSLVLFIGVDGLVGEELYNCLQLYEKHDQVKVRYFAENRGLAAVLNDLITLCKEENYEFIARMDADDISLPDRLEKQMHFLLTHPEIDVVGGSIMEIDEQGKSLNKKIIYPSTPEGCKSFFAKRNPLAHPAVLFRYRYFEKSECLYRPEYRQNQDTLLWFDGLRKGCLMANIPDVVLNFRMTNDLFKKRRNGYSFAKKSLRDRFMINKELGYGLQSYIFAIMMFLITISPVWLKKIAYRLR